MEPLAPYRVAYVATPAPCAPDALCEALATYTAQAQALADLACPGMGVAVSIDSTEKGPHYTLYTYDLTLGRASYLHRTGVGAGYSPTEALAGLADSLHRRYGSTSQLAA